MYKYESYPSLDYSPRLSSEREPGGHPPSRADEQGGLAGSKLVVSRLLLVLLPNNLPLVFIASKASHRARQTEPSLEL